MKDFFNIDDDYLEDEESKEAKELKEKINKAIEEVCKQIQEFKKYYYASTT